MVTPYFFTDCDVMPEQDAALGYGSVSATSFRLTSSFTASVGGAALRAYAVCRGAVLIQEVDGHPDLVNLVLKPERQPNPHYAPVEFFVYRGLKKKHFLDSANEVIGDGSADKVTDLMTRMWEVRNRLNDDIAAADEGALPDPLVRGDLGLNDLGDPPGDGATPVAELFDTYTFATVSEGDFIGEFETAATYGFEILLASPAHQHVLGDMRALERSTTIVYAAGQAQFPAAEDISIRRERERVLAFADPAAWYGLFAQERVHAYRGGRDRTLNGEDLYADVLSKFRTADRIYVDIRDELDNSLNYLGEYGSGSAPVQWASGGGPLVASDYHDGNGWPVLVLRASQIASGSDAAVGLSIALPKGASELVTGYLAQASLLADFPDRVERFVNLGFNGSTWTDAFEIGLHNNPSAGAVYPAIVEIAVGKRIDPATFTEQGGPSDRFIKNDLLDNLFQPRSIALVDKADHVAWKAMPQPRYVGWTSTAGWDFMVKSGVARDSIGEVAFCYRHGPPEVGGATGYGRSMSDVNLDAGIEETPSFFLMLRDLLAQVRLEARTIVTGSGAEIACIRVLSENGNFSIDPFNRSGDDIYSFAYAEAERADIVALHDAGFWPEAPRFYVALQKALRSDVEDFPYFELELGIQGVVLDAATWTHAIDVTSTGFRFYSIDGKSFFTEAYALALAPLLVS